MYLKEYKKYVQYKDNKLSVYDLLYDMLTNYSSCSFINGLQNKVRYEQITHILFESAAIEQSMLKDAEALYSLDSTFDVNPMFSNPSSFYFILF